MKKTHKTALKIAALVLGIFAFTGCTANFCSVNDKAHILYNYDPGLLYDENGDVVIKDNVIQFANEEITKQIETLGKNYDVPSVVFWKMLDEKVYELAKGTWYADENAPSEITEDSKDLILKHYGYLKYAGQAENRKGKLVDTLWVNWDNMVEEIRLETTEANYPSKDFVNQYKKIMNNYASSNRTCITPEDGNFGEEGNLVFIEGKTWKEAFQKGVLEGLLVYPVAWLSHVFTKGFLNSGVASGWAQMLSILFVTLIVRGLLMAITFKSTLDQQKMTALQPELAKIQEKYPNANTNQREKQMLGQAQMALYKKHKINPLSQLLVLVFQFPIFIAVWGALSGTAILTSGDIFGMSLSASIGTELMKFNMTGAWWTALVLFILMSATQIIASKLPQWMQAKRVKKVSKMGKNPAVDSQNKQMKFMSTFMLAMIIIMGFSLPSGMGIYWLFGAILSIVQTVITQTIMKRKKSK